VDRFCPHNAFIHAPPDAAALMRAFIIRPFGVKSDRKGNPIDFDLVAMNIQMFELMKSAIQTLNQLHSEYPNLSPDQLRKVSAELARRSEELSELSRKIQEIIDAM